MQSGLTSLLAAAEAGDRGAAEALFPLLYAELHRMASRQLARDGGVTLGTTSLLHEVYLDLAQREGMSFPDRARFLAYASRAMRAVIIDHVRHRKADKRGAGRETVPADDTIPARFQDDEQLARIGEVLDGLAAVEPRLAQVVDLKFFCGFSFAEIGALLAVSERTVQRHWDRARIYLHVALRDEPA